MYKLVAIAGTFDRLHKGHRYFVSETFKLSEKVIIGLTSDEFAGKKLSARNATHSVAGGQITNFQTRKIELEEFLKQEGLLGRADIVKIDDVYGPSIGENQMEALVVTADTLEGAEKVNKRRKEFKLPLLKIITVSMIMAQDKKRIASARIRAGEIDRWGKAFAMQITNSQRAPEIQIPNELRMELKKPLGKLIKGNPDDINEAGELLKKAVGKTNSIMISTVGDEVTKLANEIGLTINLAIVDFKVNRIEKYHSLEELGLSADEAGIRHYESGMIKVGNPPGYITKELVEAVKNAYLEIIKDGKQRIIRVDGEEDLAGIPAVLLSPLGSLVLYGQPSVGVVLVEVTEEKKNQLMKLIGENK